MRGINTVEDLLHFFFHRLPERRRSELHAGLNHLRILRHGQIGILIFVIDDPTFALSDNLVAEFLGGNVVSPLAEGALGKLLDVALVHQRDRFAAGLESMLDRHAHQALGSGHGNGLDADAGIEADLLLAAFQHVFVEELDQPRALRSSLFPFDSGVPAAYSMPA